MSFLRDEMNKKLSDTPVRNRTVKNLLLKNYNHLCFTYPRSRRESQMFFSCRLTAEEILESLRRSKISYINEFACNLREMFKAYDFHLSSSYCDSSDVAIATKVFKNN